MTGWKMVFCDGTVAVGAVAADAPPVTAKDTPATPIAGNVVRVRLLFEIGLVRAIVAPLLCLRENAQRIADHCVPFSVRIA
jgi:hypothetical protein